jgi:phosphatidylinositol glycan class C protein
MKWRKILWKEHPDFPDNHVDKSFLDGLEKNTNISDFEYPALVFASGAITQQFSSIFAFCNLFIRMYYHKFEINLRVVAVLVVISYLVWRQVNRLALTIKITTRKTGSVLYMLASASILSSLLLGISPILKTLTLDISKDSIWSMTAVMLLCNAAFHNYDHSRNSASIIEFPDSLSINAGVFAAVLLASRLARFVHLSHHLSHHLVIGMCFV